MEIANGKEDDGIIYKTYLQPPNWMVPDGRILTEQFHWTFEPRCGPDIKDVRTAEMVMEKLINRLRQSENITSKST